jgi:hypothetical protein
MPLISIPAVYDGKDVRLLEAVPYHEPYRVMVVFVEPVASVDSPTDAATFESSFGAWQADADEDDLMTIIRAGRRSRSEPPNV